MLLVKRISCFILLTVLIVSCNRENPLPDETEPLNIFLTWNGDPSTSMVIDWHSMKDQSLFYREKGTNRWEEVDGDEKQFPHSDRILKRAYLENLKPETEYDLTFGESNERYYFRTMPLTIEKKGVKIAFGGDTMHDEEMFMRTCKQVVRQDPDLVVFGGDLAYEDGQVSKVGRWYNWFEMLTQYLKTLDNRLVPVIVAIGNHEVQQGYYHRHSGFQVDENSRKAIAPFFYSLFAFPGQPGYGVIDFGNYLSLIILDSDHTNPVEGDQTEWLKEQLVSRDEVLFKIPVYHVAAYPSARDFNGNIPQKIRKNWVPLFESSGVQLVFENHDHAYKRTEKIRKNQIDETGIIYIGDGAWGVSTRSTHPANNTWYLNKALSVRNFTILSIENSNYSMMMFDDHGNIIDKVN